MEPDHSANIKNFIKIYPDTTIVANAKTFAMMDQFFDLDSSVKRLEVKTLQVFFIYYIYLIIM